MWRAVRDPADSPPLHTLQALPRLSCCGSHGLAPSQTPGPINQHSPATTAERSPALLAGEISSQPQGTALAPGDQPSSLVTRPLFSSGQSSLTAIQRPESRVLFVCSQAGPCMSSTQMGSGRKHRAVIAGWSSTRMPVGTACESRPRFAPKCPDVSNLHRFCQLAELCVSPEVCLRAV